MEKTIANLKAEIATIMAIKNPTQNHHTVLALLGAAVERLENDLPKESAAGVPPVEAPQP
jgi:hypothetical protein